MTEPVIAMAGVEKAFRYFRLSDLTLNVIFLPMLWLSGLFFPLPGFLEQWVVIWPAFHLNQLAIAVAGISKYQFIPPQMAAAVLLGLTVLFGGLAVRRLARAG